MESSTECEEETEEEGMLKSGRIDLIAKNVRNHFQVAAE